MVSLRTVWRVTESTYTSFSNLDIRFALIGTGAIARTHLAAIAGIPQARIVAVCSRDQNRARLLAEPLGARALDSVEDAVALPDIDAVLVATPSGAHHESILPALRAGKHVLCEKPLEISSQRVDQMIKEAAQAGVILAGFFPLRCGAGAKAIRGAVDAGRFGRLAFLSARVKWWRGADYYRSSQWRGTWELDGGGALMNQGIHAVDLLQWLGGCPATVTAFSSTVAHDGLEVEDTLAACLRYENGCLGTIEAATSCYPGLDFTIEISGEAGTAILVNDRIEFWQFHDELACDAALRAGDLGGNIVGGQADPRAISYAGHREQIIEFCKAIRGEPAEIITGQEAARSVAIVEAIYHSIRDGAPRPVVF